MTVEFTMPGRCRLPEKVEGEPPARASRPPRIACLLALAHRFDELVRSGAVKDYAELARLGHVTRARVTQMVSSPFALSHLSTGLDPGGKAASERKPDSLGVKGRFLCRR